MRKKPRGYPARRRLSYVDIERRAGELRRRLGVDEALPLPVIDFFWSFEGLSFREESSGDRYGVSCGPSRKLIPGVRGETRCNRRLQRFDVDIQEDEFAKAEQGDPSARFTICHEGIHLFEHTRLLFTMTKVPHVPPSLQRGGPTHSFCEDTEWQADAGAAALLMPAWQIESMGINLELLASKDRAHAFSRFQLVQDVADAFGVSFPVAEIRLREFLVRRSALLAATQKSHAIDGLRTQPSEP